MTQISLFWKHWELVLGEGSPSSEKVNKNGWSKSGGRLSCYSDLALSRPTRFLGWNRIHLEDKHCHESCMCAKSTLLKGTFIVWFWSIWEVAFQTAPHHSWKSVVCTLRKHHTRELQKHLQVSAVRALNITKFTGFLRKEFALVTNTFNSLWYLFSFGTSIFQGDYPIHPLLPDPREHRRSLRKRIGGW